MTNGIALKLIPSLMLAAFAGSAVASGFQLIEQNASGLGNSYAGSAAVAENASTVFYNPAGMTQLRTFEVSAGVAAVRPSFKFSNNASNTGVLVGNGGDGGGWAFVPDLYASWGVTKDLYLGLGIGAPFGLQTDYDNPWVGAAQSRKFSVKTLNINPSVAYRLNDTVSLGGGLNYQRLDAEYIRTVGVGTIPAGVFAGVPANLSTAKLELSDSGWGWNIGALFTLSPATKVGISYRSAIKYHTTGQIDVAGPVANFNLANTSGVRADVTLPDTAILSVTQKLSEKWEMLGDVSWTGWSSIPKIDIWRTNGVQNGAMAQSLDTDFRDTWRIALGTNDQLNDSIKLKFGIAYDQTPVKGAQSRLVSLPDNNRTWFSTGAQWKIDKNNTVDVGVAYLYVPNAKIQNNQSAALRGLVDGTFKDSAWILGAQYSLGF